MIETAASVKLSSQSQSRSQCLQKTIGGRGMQQRKREQETQQSQQQRSKTRETKETRERVYHYEPEMRWPLLGEDLPLSILRNRNKETNNNNNNNGGGYKRGEATERNYDDDNKVETDEVGKRVDYNYNNREEEEEDKEEKRNEEGDDIETPSIKNILFTSFQRPSHLQGRNRNSNWMDNNNRNNLDNAWDRLNGVVFHIGCPRIFQNMEKFLFIFTGSVLWSCSLEFILHHYRFPYDETYSYNFQLPGSAHLFTISSINLHNFLHVLPVFFLTLCLVTIDFLIIQQSKAGEGNKNNKNNNSTNGQAKQQAEQYTAATPCYQKTQNNKNKISFKSILGIEDEGNSISITGNKHISKCENNDQNKMEHAKKIIICHDEDLSGPLIMRNMAMDMDINMNTSNGTFYDENINGSKSIYNEEFLDRNIYLD